MPLLIWLKIYLEQTSELNFFIYNECRFGSIQVDCPFCKRSGGSTFGPCSTLYLITLIALTPALARAPVHTYSCISDSGTISITERSCASPISKVERHISGRFCSTYNCLVPGRRLSLSMKMCARRKAGRRQRARCLYPSHGPLRFITSHSRFTLASTMRKTKRLRKRLPRHDVRCV